MEPYFGKEYVLVSKENFEEYLVYTDVSYIARKAALALRPVQCLVRNEDGTYTYSFKSKLVNTNIEFTPGQEFDETKADGSKVRSTITFEDNKMIHISVRPDGKVIKHVCEFSADKLIVITTADGFDKTVRREYDLVK